MDNKLTITIRIAGKVFKPTIDRKNEETVRKAAKLLDDKYAEYKLQIEDPFDCLALSALQTSIMLINQKQEESPVPINQKLTDIEALLSDYLEKGEKI